MKPQLIYLPLLLLFSLGLSAQAYQYLPKDAMTQHPTLDQKIQQQDQKVPQLADQTARKNKTLADISSVPVANIRPAHSPAPKHTLAKSLLFMVRPAIY